MGERTKILIVDGQTEQRNLYKERLNLTGYDVIGCTANPRQGLEMIDQFQPDFVLFDIVLSPIDGITFLKEAVNGKDGKKRHYIALSSITNERIIRDAVSAGADYFIAKPFEPQVLTDRIKSLSETFDAAEEFGFADDAVQNRVSETTQMDLESQVTSLILEIGIPAHIKGFHYVRTAIMMAVENPETISAITKIVYPTIAKQYHTAPTRVERAIRHAIEVAWDRGDYDTLNGIFGFSVDNNKGKPTNSEFIGLLSDQLRVKNKKTNEQKELRIK